LTAGFADAPTDRQTHSVGQVPHWLFAFHDTLAAAVYRTLALLAAHPAERHLAEQESAGGMATAPTPEPVSKRHSGSGRPPRS